MHSVSKIPRTKLAIAISSLICLSANAAIIPMDTIGDNGNLCTLRDAINSINHHALEPGCLNVGGEFGDNDTIRPFLLGNASPVVVLAGSALSISEDMIIDGSYLDSLTVDGNDATRVFNIFNSSAVTMYNVSVTGGSTDLTGAGINVGIASTLNMSDCTIQGNTAGTKGGGVSASNSSDINFLNCSIKDNKAGTS